MICKILYHNAVWFDLVRFLKYKPQTELNCAVLLKNDSNTSEINETFVVFLFDSIWLTVFYWDDSILNTPTHKEENTPTKALDHPMLGF